MNYIKEKLNNIYIPLDSGKLGLFFSILAISFVVSSSNSPCLQAQSTCAIGSDNEFTGNISLKGGTANKGTFDASGLTSDRTWTLPDATGTLAVVGATLPASKVMATDVSGNESTTDVYPLSLTSSSPLKTDALGNVTASDLDPETDLTVGTGIAAQVLSVNSGATALEFTSITGVPTLTADKFVITDGAGALTTTSLIPMSFGANKPIVSDGAGNLTDVTLTADTPMKTDGNGNTSASDLDITTDITPGSALQEIRVNSGGTALEYFTPSGGSDVTLVASGNVIMNSAFGSLPQTGANICWFTQAGKLDDDKSYRLVVEFDTYSGQLMNTAYQNNAYWNPLFYASSVPDCGDTTNNNNGFNENVWSMTQNMPFQYAPNNVYFSNGYSENSGVTYVDCCIPLYPYGAGQGGITSYVSASNMIMDFSPFQDSVFSSSYKVGLSAQYTVNGYVQTTQLNPTNDIVSAWQIIGNATSLGNTQGGSLQSNDRKFEDFQGLKIGCWSQYCFGGDTTWALYELNR